MNNRFSNRYLKKIILLLSVAAAVCSCKSDETVYYSFQPVPTRGWQPNDTITFSVQVPDSQTTYRLYIGVRNRNDFAYRDLELSVSCIAPGNHAQPVRNLGLRLADDDGFWLGIGIGALYQSCIPACHIPIDSAGTYYFKLAHTLPDSLLKGINDIGIKLER